MNIKPDGPTMSLEIDVLYELHCWRRSVQQEVIFISVLASLLQRFLGRLNNREILRVKCCSTTFTKYLYNQHLHPVCTKPSLHVSLEEMRLQWGQIESERNTDQFSKFVT